MDSRRWQWGAGSAVALALLLPALTASASGARQGVKAQAGEMVLLRDVAARPAYRPAPPGMALIADTSPRRELGTALGTSVGMDELSDSDFAGMGSSAGAGSVAQPGQTTVERITSNTLGALVGGGSGSNGAPTSGLGQALGGPLEAVGGSTRGIGDQVRGALAQFPLGQPTTGGGP